MDPSLPVRLTPDAPPPVLASDAPAPLAATLLRDLNTNLWASLKHTFDTDRVTLTTLYLSNLGGLVLVIASAEKTLPLMATVGALGVINSIIYTTFKNSQREMRRLIALLSDVYTDAGLGKYFDQLREQYYVDRYETWLKLCPTLFGIALVVGLAFGLG